MNFPEITSHQIIAQILKKYTFPNHLPVTDHLLTYYLPKNAFLRFFYILTSFSSFLLYLCRFLLFSRILRQNLSIKKFFLRYLFALHTVTKLINNG
jgi:hypothetical protein